MHAAPAAEVQQYLATVPKPIAKKEDSPLDICQRLIERRERGDASAIRYKEACALRTVRDRLRALPPRLQETVRLSRYLEVVLGMEIQD